VQKKLYATSRQEAEQNNTYRERSKEKIRKIIGQYYAPFNRTVKIKFGDEGFQNLPLN
jgi:hypothetical protein